MTENLVQTKLPREREKSKYCPIHLQKCYIQPKVVHWLNTAVVRPIVLSGICVLWTALNKKAYLNSLMRVQRQAELCINAALKTTPSAVLGILLNFPSLDIVAKKGAKNSALRFAAYDVWKCNDFSQSNLLPVNHINTDSVVSFLRFGKTFEVEIPTRDDWNNQHQNLQKWPEIYTDGSRLDGRVGAGIYSTCLTTKKAIQFPDHCSVFQAEICAIHEVINWLRANRQSHICLNFVR